MPGEWTDADLAYQAEHVATMRLQNSGHNCIAGQVVIMSEDWAQRDAFLAALRRAYATAPERPIWYPGSDDRMQQALDAYPGRSSSPTGCSSRPIRRMPQSSRRPSTSRRCSAWSPCPAPARRSSTPPSHTPTRSCTARSGRTSSSTRRPRRRSGRVWSGRSPGCTTARSP
ncbi:hypothetical protein [Microbacterium sp. NIBRBAC000506063]|uniref:hypothetical protein n=1 Tax=Microbacterium sp. NIBRBAC000506063 TaxID=2734618 RepID=UPI001CB723C9|nr:hypothetical protein [Microbacterium sp. NIBRBAC000506063]